MYRRKCLICFVLLLLLVPFPTAAETIVPMPDKETLSEVTLYRVIDGDTAVFESNKIMLTVRLIGVNAPESGTLYATNSTDYLKSMLDGATVYLEKGAEQVDDYGRLLAYVWLEDGTLLNACLLRDGAAAICFFPPNLRYADLLTKAQASALDENKGMWALYRGADDDGDVLNEVQYIGNIKSHALHKLHCASLPIEKNRIYFTSYEEAISSGYHECQNCFK